MFAKYFTVFAASAAVAFAYTAPTTQCTDGCNPIGHPGLQEAVPAGTDFTVTWTPTTPGTVTILLLRGPAENLAVLGPIAENIPNSGSFKWSVSSQLETDVTHYGIQLINDADGTFQYSTQFGVSGGSGTASASISGSASSAPTGAANTTASAAVTSAPYTSGSAYTNTSIISPTGDMTVPSTLETAAATSTLESAAATTAAATSAKASGGAGAVQMSFGGAMLALFAAAL
jgi:hypothetical protein